VPLHPPREPLTGDSHAHLLVPLQAFAESVGYSVSFEAIPGAVGGWCDASARRIVVDADAPANAQVRTLIHECAHAAGIDYQSYSRSQGEVMVDTAIFSPRTAETRVGTWVERALQVSPPPPRRPRSRGQAPPGALLGGGAGDRRFQPKSGSRPQLRSGFSSSSEADHLVQAAIDDRSAGAEQ
jgi:hypothetical protein